MQLKILGLLVYSISCGLIAHSAYARDEVDLQLVILADVSSSMDGEEKQLQQQGFADAFRQPALVDAILSGTHHRIAVAYVEWGGTASPRPVIPWTLIDSPEAAKAFAARLQGNAPGRLPRGTSINTAFSYADYLFKSSPFEAPRNVVNISGDGVNNDERGIAKARDLLVASGVTINGLPILYKGLMDGVVDGYDEKDMPREQLVGYFKDEVIGGRNAFVEPVTTRDGYTAAIYRKLLREIYVSQSGAPNGRGTGGSKAKRL